MAKEPELQAFKYGRSVLDRLDELVVNTKFMNEVDMLSMSIKAKPFKDADELLPLCYRCSHHSPLLNDKGNYCSNCGQPYVFSFNTFDILPLVEFVLPSDISDQEAVTLIDYVPNSQFEKDPQAKLRESMSTIKSSSIYPTITILYCIFLVAYKAISY
jgi:intraflagellar transport protein 122